MQTARPVGLSQDGRSLLVATPTGEELAIPVDDRFHAALRGDRPRLGQLEIEMDNALGPRDIQARIRAGQSLEEVGRVAGLPLDRVERFAAPVLAEREHIALVALSSSVRRRGESSGHRTLRMAVAERLQQRGVDADTVDWDSHRREDGRWSVVARYPSGETQRQAAFVFDLQGRFCLADDDEGRWLLGEQTSLKGPQPGRRRPMSSEDDADTEPTLDLSDELALVRVVQPLDDAGSSVAQVTVTDEQEAAAFAEAAGPGRVLHPVPDQSAEDAGAGGPTSGVDEADEIDEAEAGAGDERSTAETAAAESQSAGLTADEREVAEVEAAADTLSDSGTRSPLDNLAGMFSAADADAQGAYGGLSDASAVPETDNSAWVPGIVVDYPVEPSPEPAADGQDQESEAPAPLAPTAAAPVEPSPVREPGTGDQVAKPGAPAAGKRKRAAVPSWDEIMFGGPPRSS